MKKALIALGGVVALVVIVVVVAFVAIDPTKLVNEKKDALLKDVSAKIGREVTAGQVQASVGSTLWARISSVRVAGREGKPAQLEIGSVDVRFSLLRALLSFGSNLTVEQFTVTGLVVRAARDADGRWDFDDVTAKLAGDPAEESDKPKSNPLEGARIAAVTLKNGRVELDDAQLGRPLAISGLNVDVSDIELGKPLAVKIAAVLEDGQKKSALDVATKLAVLPKDLSFDPLPDTELAVKIADLELAPWAGLAPGDVPAPVAGTVRTELTASAKDGAKTMRVQGTVNARGLVLRDTVSAIATADERAKAPRGGALDADVQIAFEQSPGAMKLEKLTFTGSGADVKASLESKGTGLAGLESADISASVQDLGKLLAVLPPSLRGLPEAARIEGPLSAKVTMKGAALEGALSLDGARVRYLDVKEGTEASAATEALFDKAAGTPLNLAIRGKRSAAALDVDRFELVLDSAKIGGTLSLPTDDKSPLVADVHSGDVQLASLQSMVPPFKAAIGKGQKVDGTIALDVKATSASGKQQADAAVALKALDVNLAATSVRGAGAITLKALPQGDDVSFVVGANLDGLSVQQKGEDGAIVLNKPSGLPLRLDVDAKKGKDRADVAKVLLAIGKSTISGKGSITALDKDVPQLDVDFGAVNVGFDDLRAAVPGAAKLPAGGKLTGNVKLQGGASAERMGVVAKNLAITFGASKIAGNLDVQNLGKPTLDVDLSSIDLSFDDVRPLSDATGDLPSGGRFKGSFKIAGDTSKSSTVQANLKLDELLVPTKKGASHIKGAIQVKNLASPQFVLGLEADQLDVDALQATFGGPDDGAEKPEKKSKKDRNPHGLSKETRAMLADVNGKGTIRAARATLKGMDLSSFKGVLVMTRGVAKFDTLEFGFYGGSVTATGTKLDLAAERTGYDIKFEGNNIDVGAFVADQTKLGKIFKGTVSPKIDVKGRGIAPGDFVGTAEGPAEMRFKSLQLDTLDLLGPIGEALKKSSKIPGMKVNAVGTKGTTWDAFTALTKFIGGKAKLQKPVETKTNAGKMTIEGAAGLDAGLDFDAVLDVAPDTIAKMTGDKVKLKKAVPVPMKIGGTWDKPKVTGVDVGTLVKAIAEQLGGKAVEDVADKAKDKAGDAAKDIAGGLLGDDGDDKDGDKKGKKKKKKKSTADKAVDGAKSLLGK